jgi:hypothetical protein
MSDMAEDDQNDHCCHGSPARHVAEMAVVATSLAEHELVTQLLEAGPTGLAAALGALATAHENADRAITTWRVLNPPLEADLDVPFDPE